MDGFEHLFLEFYSFIEIIWRACTIAKHHENLVIELKLKSSQIVL